MLLKKARRSNDPIRLVAIVANYMFKSSFTNQLSYLKGKEVFGSSKWLANCPPNPDTNSHHPNFLNFFYPRVTILVIEPNIVDDVHMQQPPFSSNKLLPLGSWSGLELKENICVDSQWHIEGCPPSFVIQCFALQKTTTFKCKARINLCKYVNGIPTPC